MRHGRIAMVTPSRHRVVLLLAWLGALLVTVACGEDPPAPANPATGRAELIPVSARSERATASRKLRMFNSVFWRIDSMIPAAAR